MSSFKDKIQNPCWTKFGHLHDKNILLTQIKTFGTDFFGQKLNEKDIHDDLELTKIIELLTQPMDKQVFTLFVQLLEYQVMIKSKMIILEAFVANISKDKE